MAKMSASMKNQQRKAAAKKISDAWRRISRIRRR